MSDHGAQLRLMKMVYMLLKKANGVIVTWNAPVLVQLALSKKVMKVKFNYSKIIVNSINE